MVRPALNVNGRLYPWPDQPVVVVCLDGSEPDYIEEAVAGGHMPYWAEARHQGTSLLADCAMPSFTNPNNLSIVTGVPPSVHGISGNFYYDPATGAEVMMNDPALLRCDTILSAFHKAGAKVAIVTAKDKLRRMLGHGIDMASGRAVCLSAEKADEATRAQNGVDDAPGLVGRPVPSVYSAALSEFVFAAGVRLLETRRPDILYLSTTDYVQHKHAPGTPAANCFYAMIDTYLAQMAAAGATIAITADHGMNAKHGPDGAPDVIWLQSLMDDWIGEDVARVILPITDPYVVHHGALGSFATVYLPNSCQTAKEAAGLCDRLAALPGIAAALPRDQAAIVFELPADRIGDIVVVSGRDKALGTRPDRHDLSGLEEPLRSHGGLSEQRVPLLSNRRLHRPDRATRLRNFDVFQLALTAAAQTAAAA